MDVESAHVFGDTPFERTVAVLVGLTAVLAACVATLQQDASRSEDRAQTEGTRLAVDIFEGTAASGVYNSFQLGSQRDVAGVLVEAASRGVAAFEEPSTQEAVLALSNSYLESEMRLLRLAKTMGQVPTEQSGVSPHAIEVMTRSVAQLQATVEEQNRQVDIGDRYGTRGSRAVLALAIVAVAAVLLGLAGVIGAGRAGWIAVTAAAILLAGSGTVAVFALLT
jgi:hypothetical protein